MRNSLNIYETMKIIFDTEACKKEGWDVDTLLYLISLYSGNRITVNTFEKARQNNFLKFNEMYSRDKPFPNYVDLTYEGESLVERVMANGNISSKDMGDARFTALADKLRELFPAGKKPGYAYTWRDSTSCIVDRLKKFVLKYGDYPDEEIIDATKRYIASFNGEYRYMQLLKYFIWKNKVTGGELIEGRMVGEVERQSQLAAWLEDKEDTTINKVSDWDVELR